MRPARTPPCTLIRRPSPSRILNHPSPSLPALLRFLIRRIPLLSLYTPSHPFFFSTAPVVPPDPPIPPLLTYPFLVYLPLRRICIPTLFTHVHRAACFLIHRSPVSHQLRACGPDARCRAPSRSADQAPAPPSAPHTCAGRPHAALRSLLALHTAPRHPSDSSESVRTRARTSPWPIKRIKRAQFTKLATVQPRTLACVPPARCARCVAPTPCATSACQSVHVRVRPARTLCSSCPTHPMRDKRSSERARLRAFRPHAMLCVAHSLNVQQALVRACTPACVPPARSRYAQRQLFQLPPIRINPFRLHPTNSLIHLLPPIPHHVCSSHLRHTRHYHERLR